MYKELGYFVTRWPLLVILAWIAILVGLKWTTPRWDDVTLDGDLAHLPANMASIRGQELLTQAFPDQQAKSDVVLVFARDEEELTGQDLRFALGVAARFEQIKAAGELPIVDIWTPKSDVVGRMLESNDKQAALVMLRLSNEFMATHNIDVLARVQAELKAMLPAAPPGLQTGVTGSAAIGGDMLTSAAESIANTETMTIVLVIAMCLVVTLLACLTLDPPLR
jgi:uncharacterized membrane protein YdfJ with MMPL/SSD domain